MSILVSMGLRVAAALLAKVEALHMPETLACYVKNQYIYTHMSLTNQSLFDLEAGPVSCTAALLEPCTRSFRPVIGGTVAESNECGAQGEDLAEGALTQACATGLRLPRRADHSKTCGSPVR